MYVIWELECLKTQVKKILTSLLYAKRTTALCLSTRTSIAKHLLWTIGLVFGDQAHCRPTRTVSGGAPARCKWMQVEFPFWLSGVGSYPCSMTQMQAQGGSKPKPGLYWTLDWFEVSQKCGLDWAIALLTRTARELWSSWTACASSSWISTETTVKQHCLLCQGAIWGVLRGLSWTKQLGWTMERVFEVSSKPQQSMLFS